MCPEKNLQPGQMEILKLRTLVHWVIDWAGQENPDVSCCLHTA